MPHPFRASLFVLIAVAGFAAPSLATVNVERGGSENPMVEVAKSTIYGGFTGLLLGSAVALVNDGGDGQAIKWGFVAGTFFGFGYGFYHVHSRPRAGLIELEQGRVRLAAVPPTFEPGRGMRVRLLTARF